MFDLAHEGYRLDIPESAEQQQRALSMLRQAVRASRWHGRLRVLLTTAAVFGLLVAVLEVLALLSEGHPF